MPSQHCLGCLLVPFLAVFFVHGWRIPATAQQSNYMHGSAPVRAAPGEDDGKSQIYRFPQPNWPSEEKYTLRDALEFLQAAPFNRFQFEIIGRDDILVAGDIRAFDELDAVTKFEDLAKVLIVRADRSFTVYSVDAGDGPIEYIYRCRRSSARDLAGIIGKGDARGLPQANKLTGKGAGEFTQHALAAAVAKGSGPAEPIESLLGEGVAFDLVPTLNGILLKGPANSVRKAVAFLKTLDEPMDTVLIEVLIVQYFHDDQFKWRYNLQDGALLKADPPKFSSGFTQPTTIKGPDTFGPQPWGIDLQNLSFDPATGAASLAYSGIGTLTSQFKQNLTLLVSEDLARVVTNPHIAVINGQTGQIVLNEKFNFVNSVVTSNGTVSQKADALSSLTAINVTPTVLGPDSVHLAVNTTLATFGDVTNFNSALPGQRINELGTSVVLQENMSLILGGLVKEEIVEGRDKIPGFAKIPLLGHLFRGRNDLRRYSETVVYVIPHITQAQGFEGDYYRQVIQHSDELKQRGEMVRANHRADKFLSDRLYYHNEQLDRVELHRLLKERHPHYPISFNPPRSEASSNHGYPVETVHAETEEPLNSVILDAGAGFGQESSSDGRIPSRGNENNDAGPFSVGASATPIAVRGRPGLGIRRLPSVRTAHSERQHGFEDRSVRARYHQPVDEENQPDRSVYRR